MTREQKIEEAKRMRAEGLSYPKIGKQLGVSHSTVFSWLNPEFRERQRELDHKRRATPEGRERKRTVIDKALQPAIVLLHDCELSSREISDVLHVSEYAVDVTLFPPTPGLVFSVQRCNPPAAIFNFDAPEDRR